MRGWWCLAHCKLLMAMLHRYSFFPGAWDNESLVVWCQYLWCRLFFLVLVGWKYAWDGKVRNIVPFHCACRQRTCSFGCIILNQHNKCLILWSAADCVNDIQNSINHRLNGIFHGQGDNFRLATI